MVGHAWEHCPRPALRALEESKLDDGVEDALKPAPDPS